MDSIDTVAPAFVEMAHQIVWASAATVDRKGPRSAAPPKSQAPLPVRTNKGSATTEAMATASSGGHDLGRSRARPWRVMALRVNAGVIRPPSTAIMATTAKSPARRPASAPGPPKPAQSRCTVALAAQSSDKRPRNIMFCGFGRRRSWTRILAAKTGTKTRSHAATSRGGKLPDHHIASRPRTQSPTTPAINPCRAALVPVQLGTAVRKKPPRVAPA